MTPKAQFVLFVLCLVFLICDPSSGEDTRKEYPAAPSSMSYEESVAAFEKIHKDMGPKEVRKLLGTPDRVTGKDPDNTWYDELWTYNFRKLPGYPGESAGKADWEGNIMFRDGKVVHTRKIGWLERR